MGFQLLEFFAWTVTFAWGSGSKLSYVEDGLRIKGSESIIWWNSDKMHDVMGQIYFQMSEARRRTSLASAEFGVFSFLGSKKFIGS